MALSTTVQEHDKVTAECIALLGEAAPELIDRHIAFCRRMLGRLPQSFRSLDASRPWLVYWSLNALDMLGEATQSLKENAARTVLACQHPDGGFGGGSGQPGHLAGTYASLAALAVAGVPEAWSLVDRVKLREWLWTLKGSDGSFRVCKHGETDPRAAYCAMVTIRLCDIQDPGLVEGTAAYLAKCQTYEGGFGNEPFGEAHGGYAFCALAAILLAEGTDKVEQFVDIDRFLGWLNRRQDCDAWGLNGRTNKLVDACYSHWVGGCWPIVAQLRSGVYLGRKELAEFVLKCAQFRDGGLRDKPGAYPDAYHTNYALCGLAHALSNYSIGPSVFDWEVSRLDLGIESTLVDRLRPLNPIFGTTLGAAEAMRAFFASE